MRVAQHRVAAAALAAAVACAGCSLTPSRGDKLFRAGDLAAAEAAYRELLDAGAGGRRQERALYHLGLIYASPESPRYDPAEAGRCLQELAEGRPGSRFARHASLILGLQLDTVRLRQTMDAQNELAAALRRQLAVLQRQAAAGEVPEESDREDRVRRLSSHIATLRAEVERLDRELERRELELERIKQIDLEIPP